MTDNEKNTSLEESDEVVLLENEISVNDDADTDEPILLKDNEPNSLKDDGVAPVENTTIQVPMAIQVPKLTNAQMETVLAKTVRDIYGEKIERTIVDVIEDFVAKEMGRIKSAFLEENDRDGQP